MTTGAFYQPTTAQFPAQYTGRYFYTDFCVGWIRTMNPTTAATELFARFTNSPVDLKVANNSTLYYLERGVDPNRNGAVFKIEFTERNAPTITTQPQNVTVAAGQQAS